MFANQFVFSRRDIASPRSFRRITEGEWTVAYDCPFAVAEGGMLFGHALDWRAPSRSNTEILEEALADPESIERLGGRWVVVDLHRRVLRSDGSYSVAYGHDTIATTAALLSHCTGAPAKNHPRFDSYRKSGFHSGLAFVAEYTEVEGVRALLPNQELDLVALTASRFPLKLPKQRSTEEIAGIMTGLMQAAAERPPIAVAMTAGFDSRLAAAAIKCCDGDFIAFTAIDGHATPEGHYDIEGAEWIATTIGVPHQKVWAEPCPVYSGEGMLAPRFDEWSKFNFSGRIVLSNWASEVGRNYLYWPGSEQMDAADVAACCDTPTKFAHEDAQSWLAGAREASRESGIALTDLLYWELRVGRWNAAAFNILSQEDWWMTLFTCRDLTLAMISVPAKEKGFRGEKLYARLVNHLAPELMDFPVNPDPFLQRVGYLVKRDLRHLVAKLLVAIGLYKSLRGLRRRA